MNRIHELGFYNRNGFHMERLFYMKMPPHLQNLQTRLSTMNHFLTRGKQLQPTGYIWIFDRSLPWTSALLGILFPLLTLIIFIIPFHITVPLTMDNFFAKILETVPSWIPSPATTFFIFEYGVSVKIFLDEDLHIRLCIWQWSNQVSLFFWIIPIQLILIFFLSCSFSLNFMYLSFCWRK